MTRYFYPASRAHHAYAMALDFGMQFDEQGNPIPGSGEGAVDDLGDDENDEFAEAVQ